MFTLDDFTPELQAKMEPFADAWIAERLRTDPADRERVEDGIRRCYEAARIGWHGNVVWVKSPIVASIAGPIADSVLGGAVNNAIRDAVLGPVCDAVNDAVHFAVRRAVDDAVGNAVGGAVLAAVRRAVDNAIGRAVDEAIHGAIHGAVDGAVSEAVGGAVFDAVGGAVDHAIRGAIRDAIGGDVDGAVRGAVGDAWWRIVSPWWSWDAWRSFCVMELPAELDHVRPLVDALNDANGAGWWWPHRQFAIVADRPTVIHREQVAARGWGSHVLHCETGPSIAWGDEWALWHWHGTRVPQWVIEAPTVERINAETNIEIRRCAIESFGRDRLLDDDGKFVEVSE